MVQIETGQVKGSTSATGVIKGDELIHSVLADCDIASTPKRAICF
jgi:hypothetical protein